MENKKSKKARIEASQKVHIFDLFYTRHVPVFYLLRVALVSILYSRTNTKRIAGKKKFSSNIREKSSRYLPPYAL